MRERERERERESAHYGVHVALICLSIVYFYWINLRNYLNPLDHLTTNFTLVLIAFNAKLVLMWFFLSEMLLTNKLNTHKITRITWRPLPDMQWLEGGEILRLDYSGYTYTACSAWLLSYRFVVKIVKKWVLFCQMVEQFPTL